MKKIIFLIIATLLVIGLVLPGCGDGNGAFENYIEVGIICPMDVVHGQQQWLTAEWAAEEINDAGGVTVNSTAVYGVHVVKINTRTEEDPVSAAIALDAHIDDVDYIIGGFRTETVFPLVEATMDQEKLFLIAGAATANILRLVAWDDSRYQYVFRGTPFNDVFLLTNMYKFLGSLGKELDAAGLSAHRPYKVVSILENLEWADTMALILKYDPYNYGPVIGFNFTGTQVRVGPSQADLSTELGTTLAADDPVVVMPVLSAAIVGAAYTNQRKTYLPNAVSFGINVMGQVEAIWSLSSGAVEYEMFLDTYGEGTEITSMTEPFMTEFATRCTLTSGDYPMYTATVYDILLGLAADIEAASSLDCDDLVTQLRSGRFYETAGAPAAGYYPMPSIELVASNSTPGSGVYALDASQAFALYPHLVEYYNGKGKGPYANYAEMAAAWMGDSLYEDWTSNPGGLVPNDLVYGPGYTTGLVTEWVAGKKVGVWPYAPAGLEAFTNVPAHNLYLATNQSFFSYLVGLGVIDQYGSWVIEYGGTESIVIDPDTIAHFEP